MTGLFQLDFDGNNATTISVFFQYSSHICLTLILAMKCYYNISIVGILFTDLFKIDLIGENATTILVNLQHSLQTYLSFFLAVEMLLQC